MYAVYEVLDKFPSGRPESEWTDYTLREGKPCEKRLLITVHSKTEAKLLVDGRRSPASNEVFWQEIP
jgi:hypothetical protein